MAERVWLIAVQIAATIIGWGSLFIGGVIVFKQLTTWLKTAVWEPYTIADALRDLGLNYPYTPDLLGVQKIIDGLLLWPAALAHAVIWAVGLAVVGFVAVKLEEIERDQRLAEQARKREIRERENREAAKEAAERSRAEFDFLGEFQRTRREE
jgi:hypothetical protein